MKYPARLTDANGWKIPNDGTLSKRVYDLAVAGKAKEDIAAELGKPVTTVNAIMAYFMPPKPRHERSAARPLPPIGEAPKADLRPDLSDEALDRMIDSYTVALKALAEAPDEVYRAVGEKREELLVLRLDRDMEKHIQKYDADGSRGIRTAYEQSKSKIVKDGIPNFFRRH